MGISDLFLGSFVVFALLGIASSTADIESIIGLGRGLKLREDNSDVVRVEGRIYCLREREQKLLPVQGATARVSCLVNDDKGNIKNLVVTPETNVKGEYTINLSENTPEGYILDTQYCLVTIGFPAPNSDCTFRSNINDGISSVRLTTLNPTCLPDNSILYSLNPFVFIFFNL